MGDTNIIELNGKHYDAVSGALLGEDSSPVVPVAVKTKPVVQEPAGKVIDDFIHHSAPSSPPASAKPEPIKAKEPSIPKANAQPPSFPKSQPQHVAAHRPESAVTLMRTAVKKPAPALKTVVRVQTPAGSSLANYEKKLPADHTSIDTARLDRAQNVAKSSAVRHFGEPKQELIISTKKPPLEQKAAPEPAVSSSHQKVLEAAIASANSHEQTAPHIVKHSRQNSRILNIAAGGLALLLITGFFIFQNIPNLNLRVASARAGFHATLPGNKPSGFAFSGPIKYGSGQVTVSFHSNSDARNFNVVEQQSNWDSQTLLNDFVASTGQAYQTIQNAGRTIYLYSGNATWVNNNVWYRITGNSSLSTSQLVGIATSM